MLAAVGGGSLAWALPTVTVSYTSASTASVPISSEALVLLASLLGLFFVLRARNRMGRLWSLALTGSLMLLAATWPGHEGQAMMVPTSLNLSLGNPASLQGNTGVWTVSNDLSTQATIRQVSVSPTLNYQLTNDNCTGVVLNQGQSCTVTVQLVP